MTCARMTAGVAAFAVALCAGCATGDVDDYVPDVNADLGVDHVDLASEPDLDEGDLTVDDVPIDDLVVDDLAVDDPSIDDLAVDDLAVDDLAVDDLALDDPIADDPGIDDVAFDDTTVVDTTVDTFVDTVVDTTVDTIVDTTVDTIADTAADDPAWDDAPVACTAFGSDSFGYTGCASTPAVLGCDDIGSTGTFVLATDDDYVRASLGFPFDFYGTSYTDVSVGSNGHVYFTDAYLGLGNVCLPGDPGYGGIVTFIAGYWTDLYQDSSMGRGIWVQTLGTAPDRRFVVQWLSDFCCSAMADGIEFQIVLFEGSSDIRVCYVDTSNGSGDDTGAYATSGIQESTSRAIQYSCNTASLTPGLQLDYLHP